MKFRTVSDTTFFSFIDELCEKNNIEGPNSSTINHYDNVSGAMIIELSEQFLDRLKASNKDDYYALIAEYSDVQ